MTPITERSVSFDDSVDYSDTTEQDDESDYLEEKPPVAGVKALARNLAEELEEVAGPAMDCDDDGSDGAKPSAAAGKATSQPTGLQPPINGDTSGANEIIGKTLELIKAKSSWMDQPWAMGCEPQTFPSDAGLDDCAPADAGTALRKWKKKLRTAFGVEEIAPGHQGVARQAFMPADPSKIQLPQTPIKSNETSQGVFGSKESPYMHESHMVTPRSVSRQERVVKENEGSKRTPNTYRSQAQQADRRYDLNEDSSDEGDDLFDNDCLEGDITEEWARQIRELTVFGYRNKSEKSIQWLRTFIYEMKGTHTPLNDWCMAFELSLQNGALHWYRQLPRKTRRTWKLLSDAFIKYYCSKFNQSAKARYYSAKREDKEHVCLDERLYHVRVKDIHDVEDMINDIVKRRDRQYDHGYETNEDSLGDGEHQNDDDNYSNGGSEYDYAVDEEKGLVAAANEHERHAAAEGTFARSDNRRTNGDGNFDNEKITLAKDGNNTGAAQLVED
ncbi:hypothetical protein PHMEG_00033125 [Phytophthora megakarya]|uniref:Retrotransposon gag domain-containing protein n=1 Tax=Phytophthora megakarya TaxID=4795 RepID=A0A225UUK2_9STRA|nr:hypothetical protein PHMEG_00033125 [Phytophthora megakarya]